MNDTAPEPHAGPSDAPALKTFTVADVSTCHVAPTDLEGLRYVESVVSYVDEHGAWVWVPADEFPGRVAEMRADGMSELFCGVLAAANAAGCAYVRLDADGPVNDDLPVSDKW